MIIRIGTMYCTVNFDGDTLLQEKVHGQVHKEVKHGGMSVKLDGAFHSRAFKSGYWDGLTDFYDFKEDKFHTGLLQQFLAAMRELQKVDPTINYTVEDNRPAPLVHQDAIDEEIVLGNGEEDDITLRDYQYDSVKKAFEDQVGIINVATNGGKCLEENSNLLTSEGIMTIKEFFAKAGYSTEVKEAVIEYRGDISLVNGHGELERPSHLTFNGLKKVRGIKGHRGTKNIVTMNHPLLTVAKDGTFQWKKAENIQVGDFLVGRVGDNKYGLNKSVTSESEAYSIGAIVAEGYLGQDNLIEFTTNKPEVAKKLRAYLESISTKEGYKVYTEKSKTTADQFRLHDAKAVRAWHQKFDIAYGVAKDKHVPQCILEAPKRIQLAFLSGYLESECSLNKQKGCIDVSSASYTLINQVSLMLRNMGYVPTVRQKIVKGYEHNDYYVLALGATDSISLLGELQFISESRKEQLDTFLSELSNRKRNNKKETVPFGKELALAYRESYKKEDVPKGFRNKFTIPNSISKNRLRELISQYDKGNQVLHDILSVLTNKHYVFEEVVEISDIGEKPTFDVCMPETHSFIAEGIVNHNTEIASGIMQQVLPYLKRGERIVFFTHSKEIMHQSAERIAKRLNIPEKKIGKIGDGKFDIKNKQIVFVMIPTLISKLKDPKKGVKFTPKENVIKFIAEEVAPKFKNTANTRKLMQNYIKNCKLTTKVWQSAEETLMYIAYDKKFTDKSAQMELNKYVVEFAKIMEKKNKGKYKVYQETKDFMESVKIMIADEVHHSKSDTWYASLSMCENANYRIGLTGTVDKKDEMGWQRLQAMFSHIAIKVSNEFLIDRGISSKPTIRLVPIQEPRNLELVGTFMEAYKLGIVENDMRNETIANLAVAYKKKRPGGILISVKEIDHGNRILDLIKAKGFENVEFIHGSSDDEDRAGGLERFSKGDLEILIASTIIDEGVDMKSIGCMILGAGGKSLRQQLQRIGRGLRLNGIDGNSVMVFDFYDATNKYLLAHSKERLKIFKAESFDVSIFGK